MKIQCSVCEAAEASVLCCADEAALCRACDSKVHAANKLASKHQRVQLSTTSASMPKCDICQEAVGYFFCMEDRALLCRKCDVAIHLVNAHVSPHRRFLLTGVKVVYEHVEHGSPSFSGNSRAIKKALERESKTGSVTDCQMPMCSQQHERLAVQAVGGTAGSGGIQHWQPEPTRCVALSSIGKSRSGMGVRDTESRSMSRKVAQMSFPQIAGAYDFTPTDLPFAGDSAYGSSQQWQLDGSFGLNDLDQSYAYLDNVSSKADSGKLGDSALAPVFKAADIEVEGDDYLGQVPEATWAVPDIPSTLPASGINWPKSYPHQADAAPAFVPDVCFSPIQIPSHNQPNCTSIKRRREF